MTADIGVDLGTANIIVYRKGKGIVLREPSVVAMSVTKKKILAVGEEARLMIGRTPGTIVAIRPLSEGVIADYTTTEKMLGYILDKVCGRRRLFKPRVLVSVPSGVTNVERRAVIQATRAAGAGEAYTIEEPMAAAIGAGLPISTPGGNMVLDIGGGTTDIAVISLDGIVVSNSLRIGRMEVRGRDLVAGLPKTVEVTSEEIRAAMAEPINLIVERVKATLEQTPPELSSDIIERGITLTGGGALVRELDRLLSLETNIPVHVADDPLSCVALGTGRALEEMSAIRESQVMVGAD